MRFLSNKFIHRGRLSKSKHSIWLPLRRHKTTTSIPVIGSWCMHRHMAGLSQS